MSIQRVLVVQRGDLTITLSQGCVFSGHQTFFLTYLIYVQPTEPSFICSKSKVETLERVLTYTTTLFPSVLKLN